MRCDELQGVTTAGQRHGVQHPEVAHEADAPQEQASGDGVGAHEKRHLTAQAQLLQTLGLESDVFGKLLQMGKVAPGVCAAGRIALGQSDGKGVLLQQHCQKLARRLEIVAASAPPLQQLFA